MLVCKASRDGEELHNIQSNSRFVRQALWFCASYILSNVENAWVNSYFHLFFLMDEERYMLRIPETSLTH